MLFKIVRKLRANKRINTLFLVAIVLLVGSISIGYAALEQELMVAGDVDYIAKASSLYNVLRVAAKEGTYAREYTGSHQDSFAGTGNKKIYHWYASDATAGTAILDKNNVIFAGHCWQMIRTTDTGGVKMIYNGEPENDQCLNTRGNHVGYSSRTTNTFSSNYYYGTDFEYDSSTGKFSLAGTLTQVQWNDSTYSGLIGKYSCRSTSATGTCSTLYLLESYLDSTRANVLSITASSHYSQYGKTAFNQGNSPAYVGYMYNTVFPMTKKSTTFAIATSTFTANVNYYYSSAVSYSGSQYTLTNPALLSTLNSNYSSLVGKYVITTAGATSGAKVAYVLAVDASNSNKLYYKELSGGDLNTSLTIGDSFTKSGNVYTLSGNVSNVSYINWYSNTSDYSIYKGKYACDGNNTSCTTLKHIFSYANPTKSTYYYSDTTSNWTYAEGVSYSGGTYTLTGDKVTFWDYYDSTNQATVKTHHYVCLNGANSCSTVAYVYYLTLSANYFHYIEISGVADISAALTKMLQASDVNSKDSTMKFAVEAWYAKYLSGYDSYMEDTVFCNDRTIKSLGAWDPSANAALNAGLTFQEYSISSDLSCDRATDKFSTLNTSALLNYKVGLMSSPEMNLLNQNNARVSGQSYWLLSPYAVTTAPLSRSIVTSGAISYSNEDTGVGVRPAISLKPDTEYITGDGSMANPYVVDSRVAASQRPATPTISGATTKVYGSSAASLSCTTTTTYAEGVTKYYSFGFATTDGGTPSSWTTASTSSTLTVNADYIGNRYYSCRVYASDGTVTSDVATSLPAADALVAVNNATITFNANTGTLSGSGTLYAKNGESAIYTTIQGTTPGTIPTASKANNIFTGWFTATSGGNKVLNANGTFTGTAVSGYTTASAWATIADKTLYAQFVPSSTLTVNPNGGSFNGSTSNSTYTQVVDTLKVLPLPTRTGYTFNGWTKSGGGTVTKYGTGLYTDETFTSSKNSVGVYNNSGNGMVVHTLVSKDSSNPMNTTTQQLHITTSGAASPGLGGLVQSTTSRANAVFYHVIVAKVPVGYQLINAQNATGDGRSITWLTSKAGTGEYETYIYQHQCGTSGTFSTFGHVYLSGTAATSSNPVSWDVAFADMFDATNGTPENQSQVFTFGSSATTLTAKWLANTYTIGYALNGGTAGASAPTSGTFDTNVTINNPSKTFRVNVDANGQGASVTLGGTAVTYVDSPQQTFTGWTASGLDTSTAKYGTSTSTVTTSWTNGSTPVTAQYFKNLRSTSGTVNLTANWTAVALTLPTLTKSGYSCSYNTESDGSGTTYASGGSYTPSTTTSSTTLYVRCTAVNYTIGYVLNGGTAGNSAPTTGIYDSVVTINNPSRVVRVNIDPNSQGASVTLGGSAVTYVDSPQQTFAGWTSTNINTSIAKYGTSASNVTTSWTNGSTPVTAQYFKNLTSPNGSVTLTANWTGVALTLPTLTKTGFSCGYATSAGGEIVYNSGASYTPPTTGSSTTLYVKCNIDPPDPPPTISGGDTKVYNHQATTLTCTTTATYASGTSLYYSFGYTDTEGGTPGNWTTASTTNTISIAKDAYYGTRYYFCRVYASDGTLTSSIVTSSLVQPTEMTLVNARIYFDAATNGGITPIENLYVPYGTTSVYTERDSTTAGAIPIATKTVGAFLGWYTASSGGTLVINSSGVVQASVSGWTNASKQWLRTVATDSSSSNVLYAHFQPTYTLTYNNNGGSDCTSTVQLQNQAWGPLCTPTRSGYNFEGWNTASGGGGTTVTSDTVATGNLTVYAQWVEIEESQAWNFAYTGAYQTFTVPYTGDYRIELYGARGSYSGKNGAYVYGNIHLARGENLYIYVGGGGNSKWNGGGSSNANDHHGGGATDVRLVSGAWDNAVSLRSRIMVAGGAGGEGATYKHGGNGGLQSGSSGMGHTKSDDCETVTVNGGAGGTQLTGSAFGKGGNSTNGGGVSGGAGGGGYWGGKGGTGRYQGTECTSTGISVASGGGGGSSYISGGLGYIAVDSADSNNPRKDSNNTTCTQTIANSDVTCSWHYSGKIFNTTGGTTGGNDQQHGKAVITFLNTFTITYNNNGGSGCTSLTQSHDVAWGNLCVPTRSGYTLAEWNTKADGSGTTYYGTEMARNNITLYAIWQGAGPEWNYSYTGSRKAFRAPTTGTYKVELWGAQSQLTTQKGAYVYGNINLNEGDILFVYVGGRTGWNGGGTSGNSSHSGGGATDLRITQGAWDNATSLRSRIMVAAGTGGDGATYRRGGGGGVYSGYSGMDHTKSNDCETVSVNGGAGGTQTTGSAFGKGANAGDTGGNNEYTVYAGAGGGGYWGGKAGQARYQGTDCNEYGITVASGGGGGSSYISGNKGHIAVVSASSNSPRNDSNNTTCTQTLANNDITCSYHYSGKIFISGTTGGSANNREGAGAAKITLLS